MSNIDDLSLTRSATVFRKDCPTFRPDRMEVIPCKGFHHSDFASRQKDKLSGYRSRTGRWIAKQEVLPLQSDRPKQGQLAL